MISCIIALCLILLLTYPHDKLTKKSEKKIMQLPELVCVLIYDIRARAGKQRENAAAIGCCVFYLPNFFLYASTVVFHLPNDTLQVKGNKASLTSV